MDFQNQVEKILKEQCEISSGARLVVGVSGGPDSIALLHLLFNLGFKIIVAHVDHQLRPESGSDAEFVKRTAEEFKVPYYEKRIDIGDLAKKIKASVEDVARQERYRFLFDVADKNNVAAVAVGHSANDQAETILMHLIRGSGLNGLTGMKYKIISPFHSTIPLIRPLLRFIREEIDFYITHNKLPVVIDKSNLSSEYFRNQIRNELIPHLEKFNPRIVQKIGDLGEIVSQDLFVLENYHLEIFHTMLKERKTNLCILDLTQLKMKPIATQRAMIRLAWKEMQGSFYELDLSTIERIRELIKNRTSCNSIPIQKDLYIQISDSELVFSKNIVNILIQNSPQVISKEPKKLVIGKNYTLDNHWVLRVDQCSACDFSYDLQDGQLFNAYLDTSSEDQEITIRNFQPGDRYKPLGMQGRSMKVSDFWINKKLPREARKQYPLIFIGNELAWIPGFQPSYQFRVTKKTTRIINIHFCQK